MKRYNFFYKALLGIGMVLSLNILAPEKVTYATTQTPPNIVAEAAVVLDADTGQVIYSKNGDSQMFPASTTKVMTALITLENTNLHDQVVIGKNPPYAEGSSIGLKEGEIFTVEDILTGLMLESGNDCALALAEHIAGSEEAFAKLMTERSKALGCKNTIFKNASGLPNDEHLTTAYDLSLILKEAIQYEDFVKISTLSTKKLPPSNLDGYERYANNHNYLINQGSSLYYKYASAGKTGYTDVARHTYTTSAKKDGRTLVASFIKAEDKIQNFKDVASILDYAFETTENVKLFSKNDIVEEVKVTKDVTIPLILEEDFIYTNLNKDSASTDAKIKFELPQNIKSRTLSKNEIIDTGSVMINGVESGSIRVLSGVDRNFTPMIALKEFAANEPATVITVSIIILVFLCIILKIIISKKKKMNRKKQWNTLTKKIKNR